MKKPVKKKASKNKPPPKKKPGNLSDIAAAVLKKPKEVVIDIETEGGPYVEVREVLRGKRDWDDVLDLLRKQEWKAALKLGERLTGARLKPNAMQADSMLIYLNATQEQLDKPSVPPPTKKEENIWRGGSTLPDAWKTSRERGTRQHDWEDPDANPKGKELPKIKVKKGDKLALRIDDKWTVKGGVKDVNKKEGVVTIWWEHRGGSKFEVIGKQEYVWTFTKWARLNMDAVVKH